MSGLMQPTNNYIKKINNLNVKFRTVELGHDFGEPERDSFNEYLIFLMILFAIIIILHVLDRSKSPLTSYYFII